MLRALLHATLEPLSAAVAARNVFIPSEEIDVLIVATTTAVVLANAGKTADGYTCILAASRRAELMARNGSPWAKDLVEQYHHAVGRFADRFQIARE